MRRGWAILVIALAGSWTAVRGQENEPKPAELTKATADESVPATFRCFVVVDERFPHKPEAAKPAPKKANVKVDDRDARDRTDKMHCFVCEQGLNPVVAVLTRAKPTADAAAVKLAKKLAPVVFQYRASNLAAFVAFLTLDKEYPQDDRPVEENRPQKGLVREVEAKELATAVQPLLAARGKEREEQRAKSGGRAPDKPTDGAFEVPFGLAARKSPQTDAWKLADDDETVVVLYHRMKVVKRWAFKTGAPVPDAEIDAIVAAAAKEASTR